MNKKIKALFVFFLLIGYGIVDTGMIFYMDTFVAPLIIYLGYLYINSSQYTQLSSMYVIRFPSKKQLYLEYFTSRFYENVCYTVILSCLGLFSLLQARNSVTTPLGIARFILFLAINIILFDFITFQLCLTFGSTLALVFSSLYIIASTLSESFLIFKGAINPFATVVPAINHPDASVINPYLTLVVSYLLLALIIVSLTIRIKRKDLKL